MQQAANTKILNSLCANIRIFIYKVKLYHYSIAGRRRKLVKLTGIKKSLTLYGKKFMEVLSILQYRTYVHTVPSKIASKRIYNVLLRHPPLQLSEMQLDDIAEKKSITSSNKNY